MSRSSTNSLSDPSTSQSSGSLLLSNPIHVGAVNNTSNPHNLASLSSLEASGSTYSDRPVLSKAAVPRVLSQPQESFSQSRYSQQNPSPVVPSLGSHLGLYNVSNPCPVPFPEAGQSQLGPLTSRSTPLPPQFAQPMHSAQQRARSLFGVGGGSLGRCCAAHVVRCCRQYCSALLSLN